MPQPKPAVDTINAVKIERDLIFITPTANIAVKLLLYSPPTHLVSLEQAYNVAVFVDIHTFRSRVFG